MSHSCRSVGRSLLPVGQLARRLAHPRRHLPRAAAQRGTEADARPPRRPPRRRPGDPLLLARLHRHEARGRQRQRGQGHGQDRRRLPARRARHPRPHRDRHPRAAHVLGRARCPSSTRRSRTASSPRRRRSPSTSPSTASSRTRTWTTSPSRRRRASGSPSRSRACGSATRSSTPTSPSSTPSASSWPPPTTAPAARAGRRASVVVPADGTYVVQVRESAYGGNGALRLPPARRHVPAAAGRRPRRRQGRRGGRGHLPRRPAGADQAEGQAARRTPRTSFGLFARTRAASPRRRPFRVSDLGNVIEAEPNDDPRARPRRAELPARLQRRHRRSRATSTSSASRRRRASFDIHCYARRLGSPLDPVMASTALGGGGIAGNDDAIGPDSYFRFTVPEDSEYVISVTDHLRQGRADLRLPRRVHAGRPRLTLSIPKVALFSQERQTVAVPRGNRYATLVTRAAPTSAATWSSGPTELPAGVTSTPRHGRERRRGPGGLRGAGGRAAGRGAGATSARSHADPNAEDRLDLLAVGGAHHRRARASRSTGSTRWTGSRWR